MKKLSCLLLAVLSSSPFLYYFITATSLLLSPTPIKAWKIEKGGSITTTSTTLPSSTTQATTSSNEQQQQLFEQWQNERKSPPNIQSTDYFHPTAMGGKAQNAGEDGAVIFIANVHTTASSNNPNHSKSNINAGGGIVLPPMELRAQYFKKENILQEYIVPGSGRQHPYGQDITIKVWGGGGGGCDGGRGETKEPLPEMQEQNENDDSAIANTASMNSTINFSEGSGGGYVEATFHLPVGTTLQVNVGGGGMSSGSQPHSLGGKGGYNGGVFGHQDEMSGGGGGGGLSTVSLTNGTVLLAAYGGDGGGNTTYCMAMGGLGASLQQRDGEPRDNLGGYINFDFALPDQTKEENMVCPGIPTLESISHDTAKFTWDAGSHQNQMSKDLYVQKYTVHLSEGGGTSLVDDNGESNNANDETMMACSNEYHLHEHIQRSFDVTKNATTTLHNLISSTPYCIRVEAFSVEGLSLGVQIMPFFTKATPTNRWIPVSVRHAGVSNVVHKEVTSTVGDSNDGSSSWCEHSTTKPTGRRGHSVSTVNDQVYIFGGATMKCVCTFDEALNENHCRSMNVYSNELWHFDPRTSMFTQLERENEDDPWPEGREQHSATVLPDGNIVIIGGVTTDNTNLEIGEESNQLLADVWRLKDPYHISSHIIRGNDDADNDESLPLELIPGRITEHQLSVMLEDMADDVCINDIQLQLSLDHGCLKGIEYIKLTGPGTKNVIDHDAPQSGVYETKVFVSNMESRQMDCKSSHLNILFSDDASDSVLATADIPTVGMYRPASSLLTAFGGTPVTGKWKLSVATSQPTHLEVYDGKLLDWELQIKAKPCVVRTKWEKLSMPPPSFSPRRLHTAVAVDDSIFIKGGTSKRKLNDLWRYDIGTGDNGTWTELNSNGLRNFWPLYGQSTLLAPFGILSYGGISMDGPRKQMQGYDLRLLDLFENEWTHVPIPRNVSDIDGGEYFDNGIPHGRYFAGISILYDVDAITTDGNGPMALVFGGDGGLLHNSYTHYPTRSSAMTNFFDDVWLLSPGGIDVSSIMNKRIREDECSWRFSIPGSTSSKIWEDTCGWASSMDGSPGQCHIETILIAAWCRKQYQAFSL